VCDARDRRRMLVWLTDEGHAVLAQRREVLDRARVAHAMRALSAAEQGALVHALRVLVDAPDHGQEEKRRKRR
jgi:DNA-binding MarR family transcriptional regulator